ncbi:hypothetical protein ACFPYM_20515, partial [Methylobacterium hispanicum]
AVVREHRTGRARDAAEATDAAAAGERLDRLAQPERAEEIPTVFARRGKSIDHYRSPIPRAGRATSGDLRDLYIAMDQCPTAHGASSLPLDYRSYI